MADPEVVAVKTAKANGNMAEKETNKAKKKKRDKGKRGEVQEEVDTFMEESFGEHEPTLEEEGPTEPTTMADTQHSGDCGSSFTPHGDADILDWDSEEEPAVDFNDFDAEMDEEFMKLLQENAPEGDKLHDEDEDSDLVIGDTDEGEHEWISTSDEEDTPGETQLPSPPDFLKSLESTMKDAANLLSALNAATEPSAPPRKVRPTRTLPQEAHHFGHSHPFFSNGSWRHTVSSRRAYTRDVYDYLRSKGFPATDVSHEITNRLRKDWIDKFGPDGWGPNDDELSAWGDEEIDDSDLILARLKESTRIAAGKTNETGRDSIEDDVIPGSSDKADDEGTPTPKKRRKSVSFAENTKTDNGSEPSRPSTNPFHSLVHRKDPNFRDIEVLDRDRDAGVAENKEEDMKSRRAKRKKIQRDFKKMKAANWVAQQSLTTATPDNLDDGSPSGHNEADDQPNSDNAHDNILTENSWPVEHDIHNGEDITLSTADDPSPTLVSPHQVLKTRIDKLCADLKAKAGEYRGEQPQESPKQKKRKRKSNEEVVVPPNPDDLEKTADVEDLENVDQRDRKRKKRKSKSKDKDTGDFLSPMIHEA
jgi:hypothetical protein